MLPYAQPNTESVGTGLTLFCCKGSAMLIKRTTVGLLALLFAACSVSTPAPEPPATSQPTSTPMPEVRATIIPEPSATFTATATPQPTALHTPIHTPTPLPPTGQAVNEPTSQPSNQPTNQA